MICSTSPLEGPGKQFHKYFFSLFQLKNIEEAQLKVAYDKKNHKMGKYLVKLSYSAQKLPFRTILHPYKLRENMCRQIEIPYPLTFIWRIPLN